MNSISTDTGMQCLWEDLNKNPLCPHGPTLLFSKYTDGKLETFHVCSAFRDSQQCQLRLPHNANQKLQLEWKTKVKKVLPSYNHRKLYIHFNQLMSKSSKERIYCRTCEQFLLTVEKGKHSEHDLVENLTDQMMLSPTEFLTPLEDVKKEAQYLFSEKSKNDIVNMLLQLNAKSVLCIGTPRIHESIVRDHSTSMTSLLLDFDGRFHNFFGPLQFCWYNLFNHHFFNKEGEQVFKDFLTVNNGREMYLVCDPPFGGRVEAMSRTIKTITDLHQKINNIENEEDKMKIIFVFPYFMESIMKLKSNPPSVEGGLKHLEMSDYKVDYNNHPLFVIGNRSKQKRESAVRIFTDIPLDRLKLPESDGYKYCAKCKKWVSSENKHCKKCKKCTSKDGRTYKHCNLCQRCVKPTWKHCSTCKRCLLEQHKCGTGPKTNKFCSEPVTEKNISPTEISASMNKIKKSKIKVKRNNKSNLPKKVLKKTMKHKKGKTE